MKETSDKSFEEQFPELCEAGFDEYLYDLHIRGCNLGDKKSNDFCHDYKQRLKNVLMRTCLSKQRVKEVMDKADDVYRGVEGVDTLKVIRFIKKELGL